MATASVIFFSDDAEMTYNSFAAAAKAIACLGVALVSVPLAFGIGALGNVAGTASPGSTRSGT